jgi:hypothetical protein
VVLIAMALHKLQRTKYNYDKIARQNCIPQSKTRINLTNNTMTSSCF